MLEVESGPELENALDRYACRLHPRRLHYAAGIPAAVAVVETRVERRGLSRSSHLSARLRLRHQLVEVEEDGNVRP